ncbi:hypothetical protein [Cohaesibacter celericrescens]|uniref:hypothetical protein n=1 Tax=Cohaesibacter celericrescens TaxID=2067669 RepID=UPI00356912DE
MNKEALAREIATHMRNYIAVTYQKQTEITVEEYLPFAEIAIKVIEHDHEITPKEQL